jgi:hypothetical protein
VWAIRTYEPWTVASLVVSTVVVLAVVGALILIVQRRNR